MKKPPPEVLKWPLEVRAEMALKAAVEKLIEEHAREGRSIFVWENGKVVEITGEELRKDLQAKRGE
ncbi:MAG TPA: hypothetical protein VNY09_00080 [Candidatus Sulfotelmatobacter sp.]|jgi:hypothetical protein|nr:hypothetical protein [Candidatus Sulfotelmatobacter sp.]